MRGTTFCIVFENSSVQLWRKNAIFTSRDEFAFFRGLLVCLYLHVRSYPRIHLLEGIGFAHVRRRGKRNALIVVMETRLHHKTRHFRYPRGRGTWKK